MRDDIINLLENSDRAMDIYELQNALGIQTVEELTSLTEELRKLEEEAILYCSVCVNLIPAFEPANLNAFLFRIQPCVYIRIRLAQYPAFNFFSF